MDAVESASYPTPWVNLVVVALTQAHAKLAEERGLFHISAELQSHAKAAQSEAEARLILTRKDLSLAVFAVAISVFFVMLAYTGFFISPAAAPARVALLDYDVADADIQKDVVSVLMLALEHSSTPLAEQKVVAREVWRDFGREARRRQAVELEHEVAPDLPRHDLLLGQGRGGVLQRQHEQRDDVAQIGRAHV